MQGERIIRLERQIRREVNEIIRRDLNISSRIILTITDVSLAKDCKFCKVYYSVFTNDESDNAAALREIEKKFASKKSYFKYIIGKNMRIKVIPDMIFELDKTPERAANVEKLLDEISNEKK